VSILLYEAAFPRIVGTSPTSPPRLLGARCLTWARAFLLCYIEEGRAGCAERADSFAARPIIFCALRVVYLACLSGFGSTLKAGSPLSMAGPHGPLLLKATMPFFLNS